MPTLVDYLSDAIEPMQRNNGLGAHFIATFVRDVVTGRTVFDLVYDLPRHLELNAGMDLVDAQMITIACAFAVAGYDWIDYDTVQGADFMWVSRTTGKPITIA